VRCCKAFLPIFKKQAATGSYDGARIFNLTSLAGLNPTGPVMCAYGPSKHAAQSFTECLRAELSVFRVRVASINPSFHSTPLVNESANALQKRWDNLPTEKRDEYGEGEHISLALRYSVEASEFDATETVPGL